LLNVPLGFDGMKPHILFTGGGTAGHVTPNLALIHAARARGWQVSYVGSAQGIEHEMVQAQQVPYFAVASGKLRRYFDWQNFIDPFKLLLGVCQAFVLCLRLKPDVVFSKGGFVSVPVVVAAWLTRIPVISHESDVTPGLANRLAYPFCRRICLTFEVSRRHLPEAKVLLTGTPVRNTITSGEARRGREALGLNGVKPVLLVFGGSLGAGAINRQVRAVLPELLATFDVVHVAGRGNIDPSLAQSDYVQREFIGDEFGDVLAAADVVVSRAGANSLYELFLLRKPHLLIPLGSGASRGDQLVNAATFEQAGYSRVIQEAALTDAGFVSAVQDLLTDAEQLSEAMSSFPRPDSERMILAEIEQYCA